ncbi:metalloregulator ArsR/SmtB family transcription factor [Spirochaetia bacterium 38H-sp]|uniref:Metalloregulator ArsR/SmtB family transcription factor n=1 Tax=Rarispira pelagica TaxID=3141764 RepID=A0ABU9UCA7_9SPIR
MNICSYIGVFMERWSESDSVALDDVATFFKVLGDPGRIRILKLLMDGELCVHELAEKLEVSQSAVSHQLSVLKYARLVKSRREGKHIFYSIADEHVSQVFALALLHVMED